MEEWKKNIKKKNPNGEILARLINTAMIQRGL